MASISLRNIEKTYDNKVTVIKDLNLEIADKEFIVLVGPSGCGKSTTLRMIAGLESITAGDLFIGDKRMNDAAPKDRDIAMVFQNYALYPHMTAYRNMAYALELRRVPKAEIRAKVEEVAKVLELTKFLDRKPKELSGGQRQRVALGRAMVRDPAVFLLDEPLSNLDAKLRTEMRAQISALHRRLETTFVYVTHDQTEAMTMGDRIVVMRDGVIHQVDNPQNLFDRPDNIFVAGFIGSPQMNFIDATVERGEGGYELVGVLGRLPIANERLADYVGKQVVVGVRPEDIMEASECPDAPAAAVTEASVDLSELMGSEVYVYFTADERRLIARISSRLDIRAGDTVRLVPDLSALHVFDKETERAICHGLDA